MEEAHWDVQSLAALGPSSSNGGSGAVISGDPGDSRCLLDILVGSAVMKFRV